MLALGEEGLIPYIASIGLYRGKARNVIALSRIVLEQHGGQVPLNRADLQALPGVGRKTASVVLNELGIEAAIAVDTHVFRVSHRLGLANAGTPDKVEAQLFKVVPGRLAAQGAPLADPARPLHLHGAKTQMPVVRDRRPVSVAGGAHGVGGSRSVALKASGPFTSLSDRVFSTRRAAAISASDTSWNIRWRMAEAWTSKSFTA